MPRNVDDAGLQHAATERMQPERLGEFTVTGVLGQGGSGVVYAARLGDREVALKVLRQDQVPTEKERARFLAEARNMARIAHPGVVAVVGVGELEDGRPYLAMERLHGTNLAERVAAAPLPRAQALELFEQLASAVAAMHAAGLIHRDLKPENVMLVDGGARAVLLDFGIARATDAPPSTTTQAGMQRGTPAVMAPERFFGARATLRTDVYELAVVLYVMLTRSLPWRDALDAKERLNPLRPRDIGVALPSALESALMRALSATADERPASVAEFAGDVRRAYHLAEPDDCRARAAEKRDELGTAPTTAATTERTGAGRGLRAAAIVVGLLVGVGGVAALALWPRGDSAKGDRGDPVASARPVRAKQDPSSAPSVTVTQIDATPPDAGTQTTIAPAAPGHDASVVGADDATPPAKKAGNTTPPAKKAGNATPPAKKADGKDAATTAVTALPWCRKMAALYCTPEFEATEGSMAGTLCTKMSEQVTSWEKLPPAGAAEMDASCERMYPQLAKAAAERIRFGESLKAKGGEPPE